MMRPEFADSHGGLGVSLAVVVKGPEGIVLGTDSRATVDLPNTGGSVPPMTFDNATKILSFSKPHSHVGAVTYGAAAIGLRTAHSYITEFELSLEKEARLTVREYAQRLSDFFTAHWKDVMPKDYQGQNMGFIVGGYDHDAAYGDVYVFEIPRDPSPQPRHAGDHSFGMSWRGQIQVANRLLNGCDPATIDIVRQTLNLDQGQVEKLSKELKSRLRFPIPFPILPLQDCVDLTVFLIRSTIAAQRFAATLRGVGGPVEVATIARTEGLQYIHRKQIHVEADQALQGGFDGQS